MTWSIVDRRGLVHRDDGYDRVVSTVRARGGQTVPVKPLQALVFKLPCCAVCFPVVSEYERLRRQR